MIRWPMHFYGSSVADLFSGLIPDQPYIAPKCLRASGGLALEFKLQPAREARFAGGAAKCIGLKALFVEPLSNTGHER